MLESRQLLSSSLDTVTKELTITGTSGADDITFLRVGSDYKLGFNGNLEIYSVSEIDSVKINSLAGDDHIAMNSTIYGTVTIDAGDGLGESNILNLFGATGAEAFNILKPNISLGETTDHFSTSYNTHSYSHIEKINVDTRGGWDTATITSPIPISFTATQYFESLSISADAHVEVATGVNDLILSGPAKMIRVHSLSITGNAVFNINDNILVIDYQDGPSPYDDVRNYITNGLGILGATGSGIDSNSVNVQATPGTMISLVDNGAIDGAINHVGSFNNIPFHSVLVTYTWFGDANLDGVVNGTDAALIDTGFIAGNVHEWIYGDIDYSNQVDINDLGLYDTGFIAQGGAAIGIYKPAPTTVRAQKLWDSAIRVSWEAPPTTVQEYLIWASIDGGEYKLVAQPAATDNYFDYHFTEPHAASVSFRVSVRSENVVSKVVYALDVASPDMDNPVVIDQNPGTDPPPDYVDPGVPTSREPVSPIELTAKAIENNGLITLHWADNSDNETGFIIYRSEDGQNFTELTRVGIDVTSYEDRSVERGLRYYYKVAAYNDVGISDTTGPESAILKLEKPTALQAVVANELEVNLYWQDKSKHETGFIAEYYETDLEGAESISVHFPVNATGWSILNLKPNTNYSFRIRSFNGDNSYSDWTAFTTVKTLKDEQAWESIETIVTPQHSSDATPPPIIYFENEELPAGYEYRISYAGGGNRYRESYPTGEEFWTAQGNAWSGEERLISGDTRFFWGLSFQQFQSRIAEINGIHAWIGRGPLSNIGYQFYDTMYSDNPDSPGITWALERRPLTEVSITATDAEATEGKSDDKAKFTVKREGGDQTQALTVKIHKPAGTALIGQAGTELLNDYTTDPDSIASVTIPANQSSVEIVLTAIKDDKIEGDESAILCLKADATYRLASSYSAVVTIKDGPKLNFVTEQGIVKKLGITSSRPTIQLNSIGTNDISIIDGIASLNIEGYIFDHIADNFPRGSGADITNAKIYINGEELEDEITVTSQDYGSPTLWRRHPYRGIFHQSAIEFAAVGTQTIRIETEENLIGLRGETEFDVVFNALGYPVAIGNRPTYSGTERLDISGALNPAAADTLTFVSQTAGLPDQTLQLAESNSNSLKFSAYLPNGHAIDVQLAAPPVLTANVDSLDAQITYIEPSGHESIYDVTFIETAATSNSFSSTYSFGGENISTWNTNYNLSGVTPAEGNDAGAYNPLSIQSSEIWDELKAKFGGEEFDLIQSGEAEGFIGINDEPVIGIVAYLSNVGYRFIYWNADESQISSLNLGTNNVPQQATLTIDSDVVARTELINTRIALVNTSGSLISSPTRLSIDTLLAFLKGVEEIEVPDDAKFKVRLYGYDNKSQVTLASDEIDDQSELVMSGSSSNAQHRGYMISNGSYAESSKWVIVYSSSAQGGTQLTNAQWNTLAQMGYYAVHNAEPIAKDLNAAQQTVNNTIQHHLFNKFRRSPRADFWTELFDPNEFNVDDFTVDVDKKFHAEEITEIANSRWRSFVDSNWDEVKRLKAEGKSIKSIQKKAFEEMFSIVDDINIQAEAQGVAKINILMTRRYRNLTSEAGATANKLLKMAEKSGIKLDKSPFIRKMAKSAVKTVPWKKLAKSIPYLSYAMTAWALATAASDPASAIADELGCSRETAQEILNGEKTFDISYLWTPNTNYDVVTTSDGSTWRVGQFNYVWKGKYDVFSETFKVTMAGHWQLISIRSTTIPGTFSMTFDDGTSQGYTMNVSSGEHEVPPAVIEFVNR